MSRYYADHYDVIVIGAALAGLTCAIALAKKGKKVLVLERHNLPGGVATSFVRDGVEIEATLHELCYVGDKENPGLLRKYFDSIGMPVNWIKISESCRVLDSDVDLVIGSSYEDFAKKVNQLYPGNYEKIMEFFSLCHKVNMSANMLGDSVPAGKNILKEHAEFFRTLGYTMEEVLDSFGFSREVKEILSIYWLYLGTPPHIIPFSALAIIIDEYVNNSPYIPEHKSFEMGLKLSEFAVSLGIQIEYCQTVKNITVEKGKATGIILDSGERISSGYVVSGAYPQTVYASMITPESERPARGIRYVKSRDINVSAISVQLLLEGNPEDYNINSYCTFYSPEKLDARKFYDNMNTMGPYQFYAMVCYNMADKKMSPEGTTLIDICVMPRADAWEKVTSENYFKIRRQVAKDIIKATEKSFHAEISGHIIDIVYETPVTYAHYAKSYKGAVYGFNHSMDDHLIARHLVGNSENFIKHLYFAGAHGMAGDGEAPQFNNGQTAAAEVLKQMKKEGKNA